MFSLVSHPSATLSLGSCNSRKPIRIAFSTEGTSIEEQKFSKDMIYYSLDPQFATLLFSVYARSERLGLSVMPDAFCFTASAPSSDSIISYAQSVGYQLISLGDYYTNILTQVRIGSVIFLVGVGSLVCWKLWDYWSHGGNIDPGDEVDPSQPKSPRKSSFTKTPSKRTKEFLASLLEEEFVHDIEDLDEDDPALIQGKYFGHEDREAITDVRRRNLEEASSISSDCSPRSLSTSARQYMADHSDSFSQNEDVGFQTSDLEQYDSLPYDDVASMTPSHQNLNKKVKRRHRPPAKDRSLSSSPSKSPLHPGTTRMNLEFCSDSQIINNVQVKRFHPYGRTCLSLDEEFSSSENSPRGNYARSLSSSKIQRQSRVSPFVSVRRKQGDGSETPDSEEVRNPRLSKGYMRALKHQRYANNNSDDEDWSNDTRLQPDGEEEEDFSDSQLVRRRLSRDVSLTDLVGRLRQKSIQRASLSRDNSVSSRLSDFLKRDDSLCSNLSEYAASECSEFSLELSYKDESIANQTHTYFADIEDELNTLKSSVIEIDEEFVRFNSRPNPYLLKTTFSDYSLDSDSRPNSALDIHAVQKSRSQLKLKAEKQISVDLEKETSEPWSVKEESSSNPISVPGSPKVKFNLSCSVDSQPDESTTMSNTQDPNECLPPAIAYRRSKGFSNHQVNASLKRTITQEEILNALEWDNDCLKQYKEEREDDSTNVGSEEAESIQKMEGFEECKQEFRRNKYLPDHCSLELDLETELKESSSATAFSGREAIVSSLSPTTRNFFLKSENYDSFLVSNPKPLPPSSLPLTKSFSSLTSSGMGSSMDSSGLGMTTSLETANNFSAMTSSVDSAFHSTTASRSGSSSPLPLTQSMMSSGLGASWSEITPDTPDSESSCDRPRRTFSDRKFRKSWSSEDRSSFEAEGGIDSSPIATLSPVHEIRERDPYDIDENICNNNVTGTPGRSQLYLSNDNELSPINENKPEASEDSSPLSNEYNTSLNQNIMGNNPTKGNENHRHSPSNTSVESSIKAVDDKIDIMEYANQEWKSNTPRSKTIKQGYYVIPEELELKFLRKIRGDNYCGIRAAVFQILSNGLPVPNSYQTHNFLVSELNDGSSWLRDYSFGRRMFYSKDQVTNGFKDCLNAFDKMSTELAGCENKECLLQCRLNEDPDLDVRLCEAVKLHMLVSAIELYREELKGEQVPLFGMIMFARQSCLNPREFMVNHLNPVGDSAGLEQIEMFLMGYALKATIQVVRPSCYGKEDFICFYPDENIGVWPEVTLVAEDDRHYNVLVK